jgi:hypothetical protein
MDYLNNLDELIGKTCSYNAEYNYQYYFNGHCFEGNDDNSIYCKITGYFLDLEESCGSVSLRITLHPLNLSNERIGKINDVIVSNWGFLEDEEEVGFDENDVWGLSAVGVPLGSISGIGWRVL